MGQQYQDERSKQKHDVVQLMGFKIILRISYIQSSNRLGILI